MQRKFRDVVHALMTDVLRAQRVAKAEIDVVSRFLTGAFVELLLAWVEGDDVVSAADVERHFLRLARPIVVHAR